MTRTNDIMHKIQQISMHVKPTHTITSSGSQCQHSWPISVEFARSPNATAARLVCAITEWGLELLCGRSGFRVGVGDKSAVRVAVG